METQNNLTTPKLSPSFFFLSLGVLISLIASVVSFLNLVFSTLDKRFPDVLNSVYQYGYSTYDYESMRSALATLIIFFPVFLLISYFWKKHSVGEMGSIDQIIKKWLIYLVLFLSSIVVIVDLVTLVRYFVSGEITTRFIFKVVITLVVALFVGGYYIFELQGRTKIFSIPVGLGAGIKASVFVILAIVWSFMVMGSPAEQRKLRLDEKRMNDLQSIQWQVIYFWQQKEKLPEKISELTDPLSGYSLPVDPEFEKGRVYEYAKKGDLTFELCADFALPMPKGWREYGYDVRPMFGYGMGGSSEVASYPYPGGGTNDSWDHEAGRTCFERTIDKELYPPNPKEIKGL